MTYRESISAYSSHAAIDRLRVALGSRWTQALLGVSLIAAVAFGSLALALSRRRRQNEDAVVDRRRRMWE